MHDLIAVGVLVLVFLVAAVRAVNMGALALVAAVVVGVTTFGSSTQEVLRGFPTSLFVTLVGVTYLFALARNNGTVDWLVHSSVRLVGGRVALVPWAMFGTSALIAGVGAASPAAVAIVAPLAMGLASRYRIRAVLMSIAITLGATGGSFSPIGIFGAITRSVARRNDLPSDAVFLFAVSMAANVLIALVAFTVFGGWELVGRRTGNLSALSAREAVPAGATRAAGGRRVDGRAEAGERARRQPDRVGMTPDREQARLDPQQVLTLVGLAFLAATAATLAFDVGVTAIAVAVALTLAFPGSARGAVDKVAWGTVLLVTGIVTYVTMLQDQGTVGRLGEAVAVVGTPLLATLLICFIGALVSAFASTTGILGALIPLAVPILLTGEVGAVGLLAALAVSSSVVDVSPFSTNGALCVANADERDQDDVFRNLMCWGMALVVLAPMITWLALVVPGSM